MKLLLHIAILATLAGSCFGASIDQPLPPLPQELNFLQPHYGYHGYRDAYEFLKLQERWIASANFLLEDPSNNYTDESFKKRIKKNLDHNLIPTKNRAQRDLQKQKDQLSATFGFRLGKSTNEQFNTQKLTASAIIGCLWLFYFYYKYLHQENEESSVDNAMQLEEPSTHWLLTWCKNHKAEIVLFFASVGIFGIGTYLDSCEAKNNNPYLLDESEKTQLRRIFDTWHASLPTQ